MTHLFRLVNTLKLKGDWVEVKFVLISSYYASEGRLLVDGTRKGSDTNHEEWLITQQDRLNLKGQYPHWRGNLLYVGCLVEVTQDFDIISQGIQVVDETDSYQVRPKAIHSTNQGKYFYKLKSKRVYLTDEEVKELHKYLRKLKV